MLGALSAWWLAPLWVPWAHSLDGHARATLLVNGMAVKWVAPLNLQFHGRAMRWQGLATAVSAFGAQMRKISMLKSQDRAMLNPTNHMVHLFFPRFAAGLSGWKRELAGFAASIAIFLIPVCAIALILTFGFFNQSNQFDTMWAAALLALLSVGVYVVCSFRLIILVFNRLTSRARYVLPAIIVTSWPFAFDQIIRFADSFAPVSVASSAMSSSFAMFVAWGIAGFAFAFHLKRIAETAEG